ncbi:MAG: SHD1 domain-containing protein [Rubripirellula sp.]|nr:SHD1 domain-containing protein [Rubripirellula sp.]
MNRKVRRICQWTLVVALTFVLGSSPVSAGWLFNRMKCNLKQSCPPACVPACPPVEVVICPPPKPACCCPCGCGKMLGEAESVKSEMPAEAPAVEEPAVEAPAVEEPAVEEPAVEEPAAAEPSVDDLFGTEAPAAPAEEPVAEPSVDDLFGTETPTEEAVGEEPSVDDLFGPADSGDADLKETPADEDAAEIDDIFGQHQTIESEIQVQAMPVSTATATIQVGAANSHRVVSLDDTRSRTWIDNTGQFSTNGRLIEIQANTVRLLKDNGRTCTVSHERLCSADAVYVQSIKRQIDMNRLASK